MNPVYPLIRSLADIEAIEKTPWREHCRAQSTYELLAKSATVFGEKPAIEYLVKGDGEEEPIVLSYQGLFARVTQAANLFDALGVGPTDVVSYTLLNYPETHEIVWGGEAAGVINAINPYLEPETIATLVDHAQSKVLVTELALPQLDVLTSALRLAERSPFLKAIVVVDTSAYHEGVTYDLPHQTANGVPIIRYQSTRDDQSADALNSGRVFREGDIASLFHTGGTTGAPKLAPHTHRNEIFMATVLPFVLDQRGDQRFFVALPLFHVNAVIATGLASFAAGHAVLLATPFGYRTPTLIPNFWRIVDRYRPTKMSGVPTVYTALTSAPKDGVDISCLQTAMVGAAPISPDQFWRFQETSGVELQEGYGLTESTVAATFNPYRGEKRIGSIGLRLPWTEVKIAEVSDGKLVQDCAVDEVGTVVIRGDHVFPGYRGLEKSGLLEGGWLDTGDLGRQDADGFFWLTGRSKDLIIRGGHNIDPSMIENALSAHPSVAQVAAIGQPDSYAGELPAAYVQLSPGATTTVDELKTFAKAHIAERAAVPVHLEVVEQIPVTAVGKVFKPALRLAAIERVLSAALREAGIEATVMAENDNRRGLIANVETSDQNNAREVLGKFAIPYELKTLS